MLQCKDNLREISLSIEQHLGGSQLSNENLIAAWPESLPKCPETKADTYTEGFDPEQGVIRCSGFHHAAAGLEAGFPVVVLEAPPEDLAARSQLDYELGSMNFAPRVLENAEGVTPLPKGFPLPLEGGAVEVLSTNVGARSGRFHVVLRFQGDKEALEDRWREVLNYHARSPHQGRFLNLGGQTALANEIRADIGQDNDYLLVSYEPAFLIDR